MVLVAARSSSTSTTMERRQSYSHVFGEKPHTATFAEPLHLVKKSINNSNRANKAEVMLARERPATFDDLDVHVKSSKQEKRDSHIQRRSSQKQMSIISDSNTEKFIASNDEEDEVEEWSSGSDGNDTSGGESSTSSLDPSIETCTTLRVVNQRFESPSGEGVYTFTGPVRVVGCSSASAVPGQRFQLSPCGNGGKIMYSNGDYYKGEVMFGFRHGQGELMWAPRPPTSLRNGSLFNMSNSYIQTCYSGMWQYDQREGFGTLTIKHRSSTNNNSSGSSVKTLRTIVGTWKGGRLHGRAAMTALDGSLFDGSVVQGIRHGRGTETLASGKVYSGQYEDGVPSGYGSLKEGERLYRGQFKYGKRHYYGIQIWQHKTYEGGWQQNALQGKGKIVWKTGECYTGQFVNSRFHGSGVFIDGKGGKYTGNWVCGYKQGKGRELDPEGNSYYGNFYRGRRHGFGRVLYADHSSYIGGWSKGRRSGLGMLMKKDGVIEHCGIFDKDFAMSSSKKHLETRDDINVLSRNEIDDVSSTGTERDEKVTPERIEGSIVYDDDESVYSSSMFFI